MTKILAAPGLSMQFFTTKEPDETQIEVAIASLCAALGKEVPNFDRCEKKEEAETPAEGDEGDSAVENAADGEGPDADKPAAGAEEEAADA
ncbi:MAG: DUF1385 domain-containing protein [Clostridia bacterium]|nr:DUF1385 domain-containing protein [Clostridia bacterium]